MGVWSNGKTTDFDSVNGGSTPPTPAKSLVRPTYVIADVKLGKRRVTYVAHFCSICQRLLSINMERRWLIECKTFEVKNGFVWR